MQILLVSPVCILMLLLLVGGCDLNSNVSNNSSQGDNEYFEEPLSERSEKYATALETSNFFVEFFSDGQLEKARSLLDPRLQKIVSDEGFRAIHEKIHAEFGDFVEYKPMQWGFSSFTQLENVVVSTKIVIHQKTETFYLFNFADDGNYDRIVAFKITPKGAGELVSQGARRAYGID